MYVKAFAKINVFLDVIDRRDDGYHSLDMVILPLELHDTIEIEYLPYLTTTHIITDLVDKAETKYDLIRKTLDSLRNSYQYPYNFNITVHKETPICAGLGGGSSNAAATLKAFTKIGKIKMTPEEELNFCLSLGADVPYCMKNVPCHVEGIGEKLTPITLKHQYNVLIIKPKEGLSTKKVFNASDGVTLKHGDVKKVITALETGDDNMLAEGLFNSLEQVAITLVPEIQNIKEMLRKDGFKCVLMTGSGSCVFALTTDYNLAFNKYLKYDHKGYNVILTKTLKQK